MIRLALGDRLSVTSWDILRVLASHDICHIRSATDPVVLSHDHHLVCRTYSETAVVSLVRLIIVTQLFHRLRGGHCAFVREARSRCPPPKAQKHQEGPVGQLAAHTARILDHWSAGDGGVVCHVILVPAAQWHSIFGSLVQFRQNSSLHRPRLLPTKADGGLLHLLCQPGRNAMVQSDGYAN